ncbi:MAG: hypothetical protein ABSB19_19595 [Methylomonas sp.]|jgi:hypothetical protein
MSIKSRLISGKELTIFAGNRLFTGNRWFAGNRLIMSAAVYRIIGRINPAHYRC